MNIDSESLYVDFELFFEENVVDKIQKMEHQYINEQIEKLKFEEKIILLEAEKDQLYYIAQNNENKIDTLKTQYSNMKKAYLKLKNTEKKLISSTRNKLQSSQDLDSIKDDANNDKNVQISKETV